MAKSLVSYKALMRQVVLPVQDSELRQFHDKAVAAAVEGLNLADLPDFLALFQRETDALYTEYVKLNEGNVKAVLEDKLAATLRSFRDKLELLLPQLPQPPSAVKAAEAAALDEWSKSTESLRQVGAAVVGDFDRRAREGIEGPTVDLIQQSLKAYARKRKEDFEAALTALSLPVESNALTLLHKTHADQWAELLNSFTAAIPKALTDADTSDFNAFTTERLTEWGQRNDQASVQACGSEAMRLSRQMMKEAEGWYHLPHYSSLALLAQHVRALKESPFCVGVGLKNDAVLFHFNKAKKTITQQVEQRASYAQVAFAAAALYAVRAAILAVRMLREKGSNGRAVDLLGEKEALLVPGRNGGGARVGWMDRLWVVASAAVAGGCFFLQGLFPDAAVGLWLSLLWGLIAALCALSLVGLVSTLSRACKGSGKTSHEH